MTPQDQSHVRNRLLRLMSPQDFERLRPHFEFVQLPLRYVIAEPDAPVEHVHFLDAGVGSIIAISSDGQEVEAGIFGREGMAPAWILMGAESSPNRIIIKVKDDAWRIAKGPFLEAVEASPTLRSLLTRYVQSLFVQTGYTALSNAVHPVDERLARWILMCDDRMGGADIPLTHEFMSVMLAVRRSSVTTALHVLEGNGFIRSVRGCIMVINRSALERFAGPAYGRPEEAYRTLVGPMS